MKFVINYEFHDCFFVPILTYFGVFLTGVPKTTEENV